MLLSLALTLAAAQAPDWPDRHAEYDSEVGDAPEYRAIQDRLARGWNTWDSRSVLRHVLLPEGLAIDLALKRHDWLEEDHLETALIGRSAEDAEVIRPGIHALDGSYSRLDLEWKGLSLTVEAGSEDGDLFLAVTPGETESFFELVVGVGMVWNGEGSAVRTEDGFLARLPEREIRIRLDGVRDMDPYTRTLLPHHVLRLDRPVSISVGDATGATLDRARDGATASAARFPGLEEAYLAVASGVAWNTVYEPLHGRVVSTVGRLWNEEYGGFALFGWDNFFLAYLTALDGPDLALANVIEHLRGFTEEGFAPNDNRGNGSKSWDRSQPPVGGIMVREVHRRFPERWFLKAAFDPLLAWNRWWPRRRLNGGLLSYGSHPAKNPFREPDAGTRTTAGYESGMDDSPMYEDVPFNEETGMLELQDVGLTSLYVADCRALAELARALGRDAEARELDERGDRFAAALDGVWVEDAGYYLNHRTDGGSVRPSFRRSPTLFYPLLAGVPDAERSRRLIEEHLLNPEEFWGDYVLPSTTRDDPSFPRQRYWKGAIWPPLNFLTYLGLRRAGAYGPASELASRSLDMFLAEWRRKGYVSENYSSITGAGDDRRLSSDPFHSWGALFGIMAFIEAGHLAPPEDPP